jgi:hypothetical protein
MPDRTTQPSRVPLARLAWLGLVVLTGVVLFFALGRRAPQVVVPEGTEVHP